MIARRALVIGLTLGAASCDRFDPPAATDPPPATRAADAARAAARERLNAVMKAAQAVTASCTAGELRWEADPDGNAIARHFSRPCIPERCAPAPADIESLRAAVRAARALADGEPSLRFRSFQGFVALGEAMVSFLDTAISGSAGAKDKPARLSGLSMHYGALAASFRELHPEPDAAAVPLEPPSLTASLAVAKPGGDPCKGWANPRYCDVRGVRVPKEHQWRSDPPCIEVEGIKK